MRELRSLITFGIALLAVIYLLPMMLKSGASIIEANSNQDHSSSQAPATTPPAAPSAPNMPAEPADWTIVGLVAIIALTVLVMAVLAWFAWRHLTKRGVDKREQQARRDGQIALWTQGLNALDKTSEALMEFETDPESVYFTRPLLGDVSEPATAAFYTAYGAARNLCTETIPSESSLVIAFAEAAENARRAFGVADENARSKARRGISHNGHKLSPEESRKIDQAQKLMRQARDPALTEAHAHNALTKALELLDAAGVIVPERLTANVTKSIDTIHRKALTS
ncbi:hypothetical protein B7435_30095 [Mycolicibacterium peregrinum]|uniref:Uncharacterized protein n=1 Tax=Mycolicibacterium alvei TaxID=67081 RepID=A0A6N4V4F6_9MYCO|nr:MULTISPECIES: hypothetical protein [Mycolicibacterium]MCV7003533.1 hypothetical protein [Mycolicibacterium alvei]OWL95540.1 hypothetical protein B7435_30095 [Mycolicibacterium peregrinum]BBX30511.1 hypothetical protein MALV_56360 [Mycolicibacterium alvei]